MRQEFYQSLVTGEATACPCCGRYAQIYRRRLHTSVCLQLIQLYRIGGPFSYVHVSKLIPKGMSGSGDFTKAKYWALIEENPADWDMPHRSGNYKLTSAGVGFVRNETPIMEVARVFDDEVLGYEGRSVYIREAVQRKFNYDDLMEGLL